MTKLEEKHEMMNSFDAKLQKWDVEDRAFWEVTGKYIAYKNLWISIGCLLLAFCVWLMWSIITVQMKNLGFPFDDGQLFTLTAVAGLTGATLRIPSSFLVAISGGRNINFVYTGLLIIPALFTGIALQTKETPYFVFVILAALSGIGGGLFAPSMSNISFFFPKKIQGLALGLNAGLGNLGVSVMQVVLPIVMSFSLFGLLAGSGFPLPTAIGEKSAGSLVYIQNAGFVWVPFLAIFSLLALTYMNNLPIHNIGNNFFAILKAFGPLLVGFTSSLIGLYLLLILKLNMLIVLPITVILTMLLMRISPQGVRKSLDNQFQIFKNKHTWIMTVLYTMSFGSFIGFSAALPLFIKIIFGVLPDGSVNPEAPNPFHYAWLGPLVGSICRPVGGWISDKISGSKVNHINTFIMILATCGVAYFVKQAQILQNPEHLFLPFLILFLVLFITTGIGNGSNFRMVPMIFEPKLAGPVLGWISAIAAYGAFVVPNVIGAQVKAHTPEYALYGFAIFYSFCLFLNWWFYRRKQAEVEC
jgi:NNP family nitrate/nitrite transporter-like MFS transporter